MQTSEPCYWSFSYYQSDYSQSKRQALSGALSCSSWCFLRYLGRGKIVGLDGETAFSLDGQQTQVCLGVSQLFLELIWTQCREGTVLFYILNIWSGIFYLDFCVCVSAFSRFFLLAVFVFQLFDHIACRTLVDWSRIKVTQSYGIRVCLQSSSLLS